MFKLTIETGNAAFEGFDRDQEVSRILRGIALLLANGTFPEDGKDILDINGNKVGRAEFTAE